MKRLKIISFIFILLILPLLITGCFGNKDSDFRNPKTADLTLTITPTVIYVDHRTNMKTVLRELNGVGVDLNYIEWLNYNESGELSWHSTKTGKEAEEQFDKIFGMHYLLPWGTLENTVSVLFGPGYLGKHVLIMGGDDSNSNSVRASAEYWVRR